MATGAAEPLFDSNASVEDVQEVRRAPSAVSVGARTFSSKYEMKYRPFIKPMSQMTMMEQVTAIVAVCSIFLALVAMIAEWSMYAVIAGLLQMIMGTYAYYQQNQITIMVIMREKTNALEADVNRFSPENTRMTYTIDELEGRVEDLLDVEDALEVITLSESQSVEALEKDAEINREIVSQLQPPVQASVVETLISSIFCREKGNDTISKEEAEGVILKLKDIPGLLVNEDRFNRTVVGNTTESFINVLQNLLDEDMSAHKQIFRVY